MSNPSQRESGDFGDVECKERDLDKDNTTTEFIFNFSAKFLHLAPAMQFPPVQNSVRM